MGQLLEITVSERASTAAETCHELRTLPDLTELHALDILQRAFKAEQAFSASAYDALFRSGRCVRAPRP